MDYIECCIATGSYSQVSEQFKTNPEVAAEHKVTSASLKRRKSPSRPDTETEERRVIIVREKMQSCHSISTEIMRIPRIGICQYFAHNR